MVKFRKLFTKKTLINALKSLGALRFRVSHTTLIFASLLFIMLTIAFMIRLLPMRWGTYLSEFDPYWQYRLTKHMVENGPFSWTTGWSTTNPSRDFMSWYPYGRNVARSSFPGLAFTAASSYLVLNALGLSMTLLEFVVLFPAIMGTLTCLVIFFLGKDIGGKEVGLFSALFLALNAAYIGRTSWGFFDDETVGIFGILLFILFFLRSLETEKPLRNTLIYAIAAGLSLGYIFASWGASRYPLGMTVLFVFVILLMRRYSSRLLLSYSTTFGIALFIAVNIPFLGFRFLTESSVLPVFGVFLLLCIYEAVGYIKTAKMKTVFILIFLASAIILVLLLSWFGVIRPLQGKYASILNPFERLARPLVESVQEHRPAAWGSFYFDFGIGAFFVPVGVFFAVRNPTNRNVFLGIFGLTSIYFASSMIRLTLLMAPALCLLWALALVRLLKPFVTLMREAPMIPGRKTRFATRVGKEFSGAILIVMFLLLLFTFVLPEPRVFNQANSPTTIAAASIPVKPSEPIPDWINTLAWMQENLPSTAVVASWWDYGYWITTLGNKTTLADNGTFNMSQIQNIGLMFMSNETEAIKVLEKWNREAHRLGFQNNVTHVLVFTTFDGNGRDVNTGNPNIYFGDEGKWRWMARIAAQRYPFINETEFGEYDEQGRWSDWSAKGKSTLIYKLMTFAKKDVLPDVPAVQQLSLEPLQYFEKAYFSRTSETVQDALNTYGVVPLVCLYKINYEGL